MIRQEKWIKEVIVVEGKNDAAAVQRAVKADFIETRGSAVGKEVIDQVRRAATVRGVIILTDPDVAGERIRRIISREVPGCKHAFISRKDAETAEGIGVEYASVEAIRSALNNARWEIKKAGEPEITWKRYLEAGLAGGAKSRQRREALAQELQIGYGNGKQLFRRLSLLRISRQEFEQALIRAEREEQHGWVWNRR